MEDAVDAEFSKVVDDENADTGNFLKNLQEWNILRTSCKNIAWKSSDGNCYKIKQVFAEQKDYSYVQHMVNRIETVVISDASRKENLP